MLRSTGFGRSIRTVHNAHAAASMGIDVGRVKLLTFAPGIEILATAATLLLPGKPESAHAGSR
jgi:branched-chain amino acid transport system permease protein